jgi:hypothetical protein
MLKIGQLKSGDVIMVNDDGTRREGTVVKINREENQALVNNGVQEFWYSPEDMNPIPLDEGQLMKLGFESEQLDGGKKYKKDSFRLVTPQAGNFSTIEIWYREDRRQFNTQLAVHELQNHHLDMTKVYLERH